MLLSFGLTCALSSALLASPRQKVPVLRAESIHQLVKNVAWNELKAAKHPRRYYRYLEKDVTSDGSTIFDKIATPFGDISRLLEVDNHAPSPQQLRQNQQLLDDLPGDVKLQQSRMKDQQNNMRRRDNVIKDLPSAFTYTYAGRNAQGLIMLKFRPSPDFRPSSRQSLILQGMAGELWIDPTTQRMVKIDGKLIEDVKIGWGFLARLNKGGTFLMEQSKGPDGTWHQKLLSVHFDGTEFVFKHIHIDVNQIRCCFEPLPGNLNIREAVSRLKGNADLPTDWKSRLQTLERARL